MAKFLRQIDNISVRETEGANIVKELIQKDVPVVLDPTLLLTAEEWLRLDSSVSIQEPYIFCYLFSDLEYIDKVKKHFKRKTNLKLVSFPFSTREMNSDDEKIYKADPSDFISIIKNATLVITDSFHATAFSINMKIPFYSLLRQKENDEKNMNSRLKNILNICNLSGRLITPESAFPEDIFSINFDQADLFLQKKRQEDLNYLKNALGD